MLLFILKIVIGVILGILFGTVGGTASVIPLTILWGLGMSFAFKSHLRWLSGALRSATQLSVISFLSFGTGLLGFLLLIVVLLFNITLGWLYGIYILVRDLITLCRGGTP